MNEIVDPERWHAAQMHRVSLVGVPGSGKTTVGRQLASVAWRAVRRARCDLPSARLGRAPAGRVYVVGLHTRSRGLHPASLVVLSRGTGTASRKRRRTTPTSALHRR
jgi:ABC-type molybdenum transport system ATPase subunit/photorepair protein PhrA